ncbi:MAG TPA: hypothetical protein VNO26_11645 [Candidatus Limnocylindria bacterium]|nr:hypothetical protein [Candidatus Limnocylindria bacterium]
MLAALVPALVLAIGLACSWGRWGDIVIDWGRELEIARRLAAGERLYADVHYWYGPLAPHLNALLFTLFGVHTGVLQGAGLCSLLLMAGLLWALTARLGGVVLAAVASSAFLALCAFNHYYVSDIFNWVTPYAYPATYGMLFATGSLYALVRRLQNGGRIWFGVALVLLALALLTKLEPAFAALTAHVAFASVIIRRGEQRLSSLALAYGAVLTVTAALSTGFLATVASLINARTAVPVMRYMGWSEWRAAVPAVASSALRLAACAIAPFAAVRLAAASGIPALGMAVATAIPIAAFAGVSPELALRGLPIAVVLGLVDALRRLPAAASDVVLWAFAAGALARLPLAAGAYHYGFYLLPVPLAVVLLAWFCRLPNLFGGTPRARAMSAVAAAAMVATLAWTHMRASAAMYRNHTAHVVTVRGNVWLLDDVGGFPFGQVYAATVERLRAYPADTTVFAAPEGAGLAFLAGLPTWGPDLSYYPPAVGPDADTRLRAALAADPPGLWLLLNFIDLRHYGSQGFGRDYGTESAAWLQQHYEPDRILPGNTIVIARPRGTVVPAP